MAYADIMSKVPVTMMMITPFAAYYPSAVHMQHSICIPLHPPQSCHDEEEEDGEEVKSFEVGGSVAMAAPAVNRCAADTCLVLLPE